MVKFALKVELFYPSWKPRLSTRGWRRRTLDGEMWKRDGMVIELVTPPEVRMTGHQLAALTHVLKKKLERVARTMIAFETNEPIQGADPNGQMA